ncbi:MAG: hypothetical protein A2Y10_12175 [Planctomycetes bacterium GWF2_41_51]|nr:MAG: hypothetical protein A2Y10_12175 [Planctomycetes bacterium GWF2_41_51]HBG28703.1 hypothetical protein [Phycisphaerales bacterium]
MKSKKKEICKQVKQIYDWLDAEIKSLNADCCVCGKCCDFDSFGHKLFITSPELYYFYENLKPLKKMPAGVCPYMENGKCTARDFRFTGCRIFFCKADDEKINDLSEQAIRKFKGLCNEYNFPYSYMELSKALNEY